MNVFKPIANLLSVVFHPVFILTYALILLFIINPFLFSVQEPRDRNFIVLSVFILSVLFPVISVVLLKLLGLISSWDLKEKQDRIVPLIIAGTFYLWLFINLYKNQIVPAAYSSIVLGSTIALFAAFMINIFSKISLHAVGLGGLLAATILIKQFFSYKSFYINFGQFGLYEFDINLLIFLVVLCSGLTLSSRLFLGSHEKADIYFGFLLGFITQYIAYGILF